MTLLDSNILLYSYYADAQHHRAVAQWLKKVVASGETVALSWVTLWAFIRISTNPRIWSRPLSAVQAFGIVGEWLARPGVVLLEPGPRHFEILQRLVVDHQAAGPLVTDASIAALAIENGTALASTDQDFARFKGLRWVNPLMP